MLGIILLGFAVFVILLACSKFLLQPSYGDWSNKTIFLPPVVGGITSIVIGVISGSILFSIIGAVVIAFIVRCFVEEYKDVDEAEKKFKLKVKTAQTSVEKAKAIYEKAISCINHAEFLEDEIEKTGYRHLHEANMNKNFERGVKLLNQAIKLGSNDATEALNRYRKKRDARYAENSKKEKARLDALPKCPRCGSPIEAKYVDKFWGSRYYHATYAPDCKWSDDKLREPYQP